MTSKKRIERIKSQGYFNHTDYEITKLAFGNRFAYILCTTILIIAVSTASITLLSIMGIIAFLGVILPYHPFDYIYNGILRHKMLLPKLPPRSSQLKFACSIATIFILTTTILFNAGHTIAAYSVGSCLLASAILVSTTDICLPSIVYNRFNTSK